MTKLLSSFLLAVASVSLQAQNVGINTTNPAERLHVAGNIKADTVKPAALKLTPNAGSGKVLTSDAAGNASWQPKSSTASIGFGTWGDCATNSIISEYNPVGDEEGAGDDYFGRSVAISGNFAIVGAPLDDVGANNNQGSVSIYQHNGSEWVLMQKITDATGAVSDDFGRSVSISGNFAVVGAPGDDVGANTGEGSASIYQYNGSTWVLMQKISGTAGDGFGEAVYISGNYVVIGAPYDDVGSKTDQGSASIYQYNGSTWVLMQMILDSNGASDDRFGYAVSLEGSFVIVGARYDAVGTNTDQGSASIYQYNGSTWVLMQKITDAAGVANDWFGYSVSITGSFAAIGATRSDFVSTYKYNGSTWVLMEKITDSPNGGFGVSVAVSGNYLVVGASQETIGANNRQGAAYIYKKVGSLWQKVLRITDPVGQAFAQFGAAVSFDANTKRFLIGAPDDINSGNHKPGKVVFGIIN